MKRGLLVAALLFVFTSGALAQNYAVKPATTDAILFVSPNGSDSNDGLSWGTAKLTLHNASDTGALDVCPTTGDCTIHISAGGIAISTAVTIGRSGTAIVCEPGAVITLSTGNAIVVSSANDIVIQGCHFKGSGSNIDVANTVSRLRILNNTFDGFTNANGAVRVGDRSNNSLAKAVTDVTIAGNTFTGDTQGDINGQDYLARVVVADNTFLTGSQTANVEIINFQTPDASTQIDGLAISHNTMTNDYGGNCVQIQSLNSSSPINQVTAAGNTCVLKSTSGAGYAFDGPGGGWTIIGNVVDASAIAYGGGNAPYELLSISQSTFAGNTAVMGASQSGAVDVITVINDDSDLAITGNTVSYGYSGTGTGSLACIHVETGAGENESDIAITGNTCDLSASTSTSEILYGIWEQNNGGTTKNVTAAGNMLAGTSSNSSSAAISGENDSGTLSGFYDEGNVVSGWSIPREYHVNSTLSGTAALSAGSASVNFPNGIIYDATPVCTATDTTSAAAVKAAPSTSSVALAGTGSHVIAWSCRPAGH